eukprot:gene2575-3189_t
MILEGTGCTQEITKILSNLPNPKEEYENFKSKHSNDKITIPDYADYSDVLNKLTLPHQDVIAEIEAQESAEGKPEPEYISTAGLHGTVKSKSGGTYNGQVTTNGIPNGFGELESSNGDLYIGFFNRGKREGKGRFLSSDGYLYDGDWKEDRRDGSGRFDDSSTGVSHVGEWRDDLRHGPGVYANKKLNIELKGIWEEDQLVFGHEVNTETLVEYYGQYKQDRWNGKGKVSFPNGTLYEGGFQMGIRHGNGTHYTEEQFFECVWDQGKPNGLGRLGYEGWLCEGIWKDGDIFYGSIKCANRRSIYHGDVKNFLPSGEGEEYFENGCHYRGQYFDGMRQGKGVFTWSNGSTYSGEWQRDLMVGQGSLSIDGFIWEGQFKETIKENGENRICGSGICKRSTDGFILYSGDWEEYKPHGYGTFNSDSGSDPQTGYWIKGQFKGSE